MKLYFYSNNETSYSSSKQFCFGISFKYSAILFTVVSFGRCLKTDKVTKSQHKIVTKIYRAKRHQSGATYRKSVSVDRRQTTSQPLSLSWNDLRPVSYTHLTLPTILRV